MSEGKTVDHNSKRVDMWAHIKEQTARIEELEMTRGQAKVVAGEASAMALASTVSDLSIDTIRQDINAHLVAAQADVINLSEVLAGTKEHIANQKKKLADLYALEGKAEEIEAIAIKAEEIRTGADEYASETREAANKDADEITRISQDSITLASANATDRARARATDEQRSIEQWQYDFDKTKRMQHDGLSEELKNERRAFDAQRDEGEKLIASAEEQISKAHEANKAEAERLEALGVEMKAKAGNSVAAALKKQSQDHTVAMSQLEVQYKTEIALLQERAESKANTITTLSASLDAANAKLDTAYARMNQTNLKALDKPNGQQVVAWSAPPATTTAASKA